MQLRRTVEALAARLGEAEPPSSSLGRRTGDEEEEGRGRGFRDAGATNGGGAVGGKLKKLRRGLRGVAGETRGGRGCGLAVRLAKKPSFAL